MNDDFQVDEKLIEAFHLMFDHFPEGVQLAHKSKRIVALNAACKSLGRDVGMICAKHGPAEAHKGCLAHKTIKNHVASWKKGAEPGPGGLRGRGQGAEQPVTTPMQRGRSVLLAHPRSCSAAL